MTDRDALARLEAWAASKPNGVPEVRIILLCGGWSVELGEIRSCDGPGNKHAQAYGFALTGDDLPSNTVFVGEPGKTATLAETVLAALDLIERSEVSQ